MLNTTLVLGAGVSYSFGYPTGADLIEQLKARLTGPNKSQLERRLYEDLRAMNPESIDAFLNEKPIYLGIARSMIAEVILAHEHIEKTLSAIRTPGQSLYKFIFNRIGLDDYDKLKIVSFNYDRSFEFYILNALNARFDGDGDLVREHFNKIQITHIHGRLVPMPIEKPDSIVAVPYAILGDSDEKWNKFDVNERRKYALDFATSPDNLTLKTVYENGDINQSAKALIESSRRVFFLGFAYNELNMKILGFDFSRERYPNGKSIVGTCWGVNPVGRKRLERLYPAINFQNYTAYDLFHHAVSLTDEQDDLC